MITDKKNLRKINVGKYEFDCFSPKQIREKAKRNEGTMLYYFYYDILTLNTISFIYFDLIILG